MKSVVILISGRGSNMEAIVRAGLPARIGAVISNRADAAGLKFARQSDIPAEVVDDRGFSSRDEFDAGLAHAIHRHAPDLVALAGFMRVLTDGFVRRFEGKLVNIVHLVTPRVDHGPIIIQAAVPVLPGDTEESLAARVLRQEHRIYPLAIRWFVEDRLVVENGVVRVNAAGATQTLLAEE